MKQTKTNACSCTLNDRCPSRRVLEQFSRIDIALVACDTPEGKWMLLEGEQVLIVIIVSKHPVWTT